MIRLIGEIKIEPFGLSYLQPRSHKTPNWLPVFADALGVAAAFAMRHYFEYYRAQHNKDKERTITMPKQHYPWINGICRCFSAV